MEMLQAEPKARPLSLSRPLPSCRLVLSRRRLRGGEEDALHQLPILHQELLHLPQCGLRASVHHISWISLAILALFDI